MSGRSCKFSNMADRGRTKRRKRRDSTTHVKPPLDFIESPLDGRKYYCTPVQAARRPFLASSLPVDDQEAMKWVSPQFPSLVENEDILGPRKKSKGRKEKKNNLQGASKEPSSNKHALSSLQFQCQNQVVKSNCKESNDGMEKSHRRSQRLRLKELKRTHFLFQTPTGATSVNKDGEIVLAYETPDQDLAMLARRRQLRTKR